MITRQILTKAVVFTANDIRATFASAKTDDIDWATGQTNEDIKVFEDNAKQREQEASILRGFDGLAALHWTGRTGLAWGCGASRCGWFMVRGRAGDGKDCEEEIENARKVGLHLGG